MVTMFSILGAIFAISFLGVCWWRWQWGIFLFFAALPAYLIRLEYFHLPTTVLEIMWGGLVLSWLMRYWREDWKEIKIFFRTQIFFSVFFVLFLLASGASIFVSDMWFASLGQWRAYFFEPMALFVVLVGRRDKINYHYPLFGLLLSGLLVSVVALLQKVFSCFYPPSLWDDVLSGRVTSFFTSPNAVGLFLVPLIPLLMWRTFRFYQQKKWCFFGLSLGSVFVFGLAILFSFSQGAWIGLGAAVLVGLFVLGYRKISLILLILSAVLALSVATIREAVLFKDRASENRLVLWGDSWEYLTKKPSNFIFGTGVRQFFRKIEKTHYDPKVMERLIYPHNIFLNFWTETGLFGLIGFVGLMIVIVNWILRSKNKITAATLLAIWVGLVVHGLVDVPYFKNDLSFLFWVLVFFSWFFTNKETSKQL